MKIVGLAGYLEHSCSVQTSEILNRNMCMQYIKYLEKGQAAPTTLSLTSFTVDLTLESDRYHLNVHRAAPDMLRLHLNNSSVEVGARKLSDGSILIQVRPLSHVQGWAIALP